LRTLSEEGVLDLLLNKIKVILPEIDRQILLHPTFKQLFNIAKRFITFEWQNHERMGVLSWSALVQELRPPHWFSTTIYSAIHRPNTRLTPLLSAAVAWAESGWPPLFDATMREMSGRDQRGLGFELCGSVG
jgi:hypothetical protein